MKILVVSFADDGIIVEAKTDLFEHRIDIRAILVFTAFANNNETLSTFINEPSDVL